MPPAVPKPGDIAQCSAWVLANELIAKGSPLNELVSLLSATVGRNVVDRTGLNDRYDIHLKWTPDNDPNGPSIFTALQEQLGLKLESTRGPVRSTASSITSNVRCRIERFALCASFVTHICYKNSTR